MNRLPPLFIGDILWSHFSKPFFAENETLLDTQQQQMDTKVTGESVYEVPDPPSMMRMKENEAYGRFSD